MALENAVEVHNGKAIGAYASQAKNVTYGNGTVEDALDDVTIEVIASVTADGTKTYSELLSELYPYRMVGTYLDVGSLRLWGQNSVSFGSVFFDNSSTIAMCAVYLTASGSIYAKATINNSGTSGFVNRASDIPSQGTVIKLVKIYKAV